MKEIKAIVEQYKSTPREEKLALATVVRVEGSSYRRMGARLLVSENGTWVGGISGGCLEGDALKRARMAILKDQASIITYDTTTDDDHQIGVGLGCNGIIDVLFTPLNKENNPLKVLEDIVDGPRKTHKLITVTKSSDPALLGKVVAYKRKEDLDFLDLDMELHTTLQSLDKSKNIYVNEELQLFLEIVPPAYHLVLFGHQYDLYPLLRQTIELAWDLTIIAPTNKVQPIKGAKIEPPEYINELPIDPFTAVVLMSHSLNTDKENLRILAQKPLNYIGMLGPRVRSERICEELGDEIPDAIKPVLYAPVGLEIGANTPEEIALSLLAEIKAVFSQKEGGHLRNRLQPIHECDKPMKFN